jgi:regulator of sirC expression with transglutaminase-like and TPR domain
MWRPIVLSPDTRGPIRIRGLLYEQLDCFSSALTDFHRFLTLAPAAKPAAAVREHLHHLERVTATLH